MSPAKARKNRVVPSPRDIGSGSGHTQDPARDAEKLSGTGEGWHYGTNDPKDVGNRLGKGEAVSGMSVRTSKTHPIRVDFVNQRDLRLSGKLGMTLAPGLKDDNAKGGSWKRDLDADLRLLKEEYDTDVLVSLLEDEEYEKYGIPDLFERAESVGIEVVGFPIVDVSVPKKYKDWLLLNLVKEAFAEKPAPSSAFMEWLEKKKIPYEFHSC